MNFIQRFKALPVKTKNLLGIGVILALVIALPLFIWAIVTQNFNPLKKAASGEPSPVNVNIAGAPFLGPTDAPITLVEFADFQCPFCKQFFTDTLTPLMNAYPNQIKFVFKNFPLSSHPMAEPAAEAAMCAFEQNKFWEMYNLLYTADQSTFSVSLFKTYAQSLGLNTTQFDTCLDSSKYSSTIQSDVNDGTSYGVTGTPTFFINGFILAGNQPIDTFKTMIDSQLAQITSPTPTPTAPPGTEPTATPTLTPTPSPTIGPNTYDNPNSCNGTCGSNANCKPNFMCYNGYCRSPLCPNDLTCGCNVTPTPTPINSSKAKPSVTPEIVYYNNQTPIAGVSGQLGMPTKSPTPASTSAYNASTNPFNTNVGGINIKYIVIGAFAAVALIFGISVLVSSLSAGSKLPEVKIPTMPVITQISESTPPSIPEEPIAPPTPPLGDPQNPV